MSKVPACRFRVNVFVYEVVRVVVVTGWSSARCCAAFIACHCVSVGAVGLFWLTQTL